MTEMEKINVCEPDYKKLYFRLFNAITEALELLAQNEIASASVCLAAAQYFAEEAYISAGE